MKQTFICCSALSQRWLGTSVALIRILEASRCHTFPLVSMILYLPRPAAWGHSASVSGQGLTAGPALGQGVPLPAWSALWVRKRGQLQPQARTAWGFIPKGRGCPREPFSFAAPWERKVVADSASFPKITAANIYLHSPATVQGPELYSKLPQNLCF